MKMTEKAVGNLIARALLSPEIVGPDAFAAVPETVIAALSGPLKVVWNYVSEDVLEHGVASNIRIRERANGDGGTLLAFLSELVVEDVPADPADILLDIQRAVAVRTDDPLVLDPKDPVGSARSFVERHYTTGESVILHHHKGTFHAWDGTYYPEAEEAGIRSKLYATFGKAVQIVTKKGGEVFVPFRPNRHTVGDALAALQAQTYLPASLQSPIWIGGEGPVPSGECIPCANGILHVPTRRLLPHSPRFFTQYALPYRYDPGCGPPENLNRFLDDLWDDDVESRDTLQELFGYFVASGTEHQKIFLVVGPKRAGKGTIARTLIGLLGTTNVCAPTLLSLSQNFGLAPLIGKRAAIIADARLGGRADQTAVAERLLSISGEDALTIDRKFLPAWTGQLGVRFLLLSNELPRLSDASGALASRFVPLVLKESFYGNEDHDLTTKLLTERPAILNWSLDGWDRLRERGHFRNPTASLDAARELEALGSPVGEFLREVAVEGPGKEVQTAILFRAWQEWSREQGRSNPRTAESFGRDLRAARPKITTRNRRDGEERHRTYSGVELNENWTQRIKETVRIEQLEELRRIERAERRLR